MYRRLNNRGCKPLLPGQYFEQAIAYLVELRLGNHQRRQQSDNGRPGG